MKVQCDVCEKAAAIVMCCADEAALCADCDAHVHAANKLVSRHERIALICPSPEISVSCDICQEQTAHSFCLEDRALLCRNCDVSIHSSNHLSSNHKRFLLTGTRASLHVLPPNPIEVPPAHKRTLRPGYSVTPVCSPRQVMTQRSSSTLGTHSTFQQLSGKAMASPNIKPASSVPNVPPPSVHITSVLPVLNSKISPGIETASKVAVTTKDLDVLGQNGDVGPFKKGSISDCFTQTIPAWQVNDLLYLPDNGAGDSFGEMRSSKSDAPNLGDADWATEFNLLEEQLFKESVAEFHEMSLPLAAGDTCRSARVTRNGKRKPELAFLPNLQENPLLVSYIGDQFVRAPSPSVYPPQKLKSIHERREW